jgi:hypothetical protein
MFSTDATGRWSAGRNRPLNHITLGTGVKVTGASGACCALSPARVITQTVLATTHVPTGILNWHIVSSCRVWLRPESRV